MERSTWLPPWMKWGDCWAPNPSRPTQMATRPCFPGFAVSSVTKVGVEGTGSYGAGVARFLARAGVEVVEVDRQNRQARRQSGKSDPLDAVEAARAALSGRAHGQAKSRDGSVEAIRVLVAAKRSARGARTKALTQMRQLTYSAPDQLQSRLDRKSTRLNSSHLG